MKPLLSIDYGEKRIGLAISDEMLMLAHPLKVIKNTPTAVKQIVEVVKQYNVGKIIVGLPHWDKKTQIVEKIQCFINELKQMLDIEIITVNEFYSTKIAEQKVVSSGKKLKKVKDKLDSYAACVILQDYLDSIRQQK